MFRNTINAIANGQDIQRALTSADYIGKVFVTLGQGVRRYLICDEMFILRGAAEHAERASLIA